MASDQFAYGFGMRKLACGPWDRPDAFFLARGRTGPQTPNPKLITEIVLS